MILHIVCLDLKDGTDPAKLGKVMDGLAALVSDSPGFIGFEHGPNLDFEEKSQNHPYGFLCRFTDAEAVARYAADPRHQALGSELVAMCNGGADGIVVYDLSVA